MHVTDPKRFPVPSSASYEVHAATLSEAQENATKLQLPNFVFVQPSTYGYDNSCLLDALDSIGPHRGRGVVAVDPTRTDLNNLQNWHERGVRGLRVNLKSVKRELPPEEMLRLLRLHADVIKQLPGWVLEVFVDMAVVPQLEPIVAELDGTKFALAHLGSPSQLKERPEEMPGWTQLMKLMRSSSVFMKISAPYRISVDPEYRNLERMTKELFSSRGGDGVVFASDWPHTRHEGVDVVPWVHRCLEWCGNDFDFKDKLFRDNAKELWNAHD